MGTFVAGFLIFLGVIFFIGAAILTFTSSIIAGVVLGILGLIFIWAAEHHAKSTRDKLRSQLDDLHKNGY